MKNLKIYSSEERLPRHNEMILLFNEDHSLYGVGQDIRFVSIEKNWEEYDSVSGHWTGVSYSYSGFNRRKPNKNCKLVLQDTDGSVMFEPFLYAKATEVDKIFGKKGWKTSK